MGYLLPRSLWLKPGVAAAATMTIASSIVAGVVFLKNTPDGAGAGPGNAIITCKTGSGGQVCYMDEEGNFFLSGSLTVGGVTDFPGGLSTSGNLLVDGDGIIRGKLDVGEPGKSGGLDVGEGGSYTTSSTGITIVSAYLYDASATTDERFTAVTLTGSVTMNTASGDRLYVGSIHKIWGVRFNLTQAKSTAEQIQMRYVSGSTLLSMDHMGIRKDTADSIGNDILEQTAQKEYVTWDHVINIAGSWSPVGAITDVSPATGKGDMYWAVFEIPDGGIVTAFITDEIKVRGSDFDIISGTAFPVFWGDARVDKHERISLSVVKSPGGTSTIGIDVDSRHAQTLFDFNGAGDNLSFLWQLPTGIDTSHPIMVSMDYSADANDTFDIDLVAARLSGGDAISNSVAVDYSSTTAITAVAAATFYSEQSLTATGISIINLSDGDTMSFEIQRTDATNAIYPFSMIIDYSIWTTGEHVN